MGYSLETLEQYFSIINFQPGDTLILKFDFESCGVERAKEMFDTVRRAVPDDIIVLGIDSKSVEILKEDGDKHGD